MSPFDGQWMSNEGGHRYDVYEGQCIGPCGNDAFMVLNDGSCWIESCGRRKSGRLSEDGAIHWEDSVVWSRSGCSDDDVSTNDSNYRSVRSIEQSILDDRNIDDVDVEQPCCTVCFEEFDADGIVRVPCRCIAFYCHRCWDRSLNNKYDQTKVAQCPTCRCPIRVDFDPDIQRLKFNKMEFAEKDLEMRQRLQEQTKPFQIQLLEQFGSIEEFYAAEPRGPLCVCGCRLVCITVWERVLGFVAECLGVAREDAEKHDRVTELTAKFLNGYHEVPITCDICQSLSGSKRLDADGRVWTCQGGNTTLLHGRSYDVCESCYASHVGTTASV